MKRYDTDWSIFSCRQNHEQTHRIFHHLSDQLVVSRSKVAITVRVAVALNPARREVLTFTHDVVVVFAAA